MVPPARSLRRRSSSQRCVFCSSVKGECRSSRARKVMLFPDSSLSIERVRLRETRSKSNSTSTLPLDSDLLVASVDFREGKKLGREGGFAVARGCAFEKPKSPGLGPSRIPEEVDGRLLPPLAGGLLTTLSN